MKRSHVLFKIQICYFQVLAKAYVLIGGRLGCEKELVSKLKTVENVREVHGVLGTYDIIAKIETGSEKQINKIILENIRKIDNVSSTITLMVVEDTEFFVADPNKLMGSILGKNDAQAYVVFHTEQGKEILVARRLNEIPEVKEADVVLGYYDVIGKIEASNQKELEKIITSKIRKIENVKSSMTLMIVQEQE